MHLRPTFDVGKGLSAVVFSVGFQNPMGTLTRVESDLRCKKVRGTVLFDLLLANGTRYNRFLVGEFDGDHFVSTDFRSADARRREFADFCASVYEEAVEDVDTSHFTPHARYAIQPQARHSALSSNCSPSLYLFGVKILVVKRPHAIATSIDGTRALSEAKRAFFGRVATRIGCQGAAAIH